MNKTRKLKYWKRGYGTGIVVTFRLGGRWASQEVDRKTNSHVVRLKGLWFLVAWEQHPHLLRGS